MKQILVYRQNGYFFPVNESDEKFVAHLTGLGAAFPEDRKLDLDYLAEAHGWRLEITKKGEQ